jgi:SAM-dependent methyltransferase
VCAGAGIEEADATHNAGIVCPNCQSALEWQGSELHCLRCGRGIARRNGSIVDFSHSDFYWSYFTRPEARELLAQSADKSLATALAQMVAHRPDKAYFLHLLDEHRCDFRDLIPEPVDGPVLCVGCGWGTNVIAFARRSRQVLAVDATLENLEITDRLCRDAGCSNITLLRLDRLEEGSFPFRPESFSIVVLWHVLEWIGCDYATVEEPRSLQLKVLRNLHRLLHPGGYLCLGMENRYSARQLLGAPEPHSKVRFGSVLPRKLANLVSRVQCGRPFKNYTYSYAGLNKLIREAGFVERELFLPLPSHDHVSAYIPERDRKAVQQWLRRDFRISRMLDHVYRAGALAVNSLGWMKYFAPEFGVIAQRPPVPVGSDDPGYSDH